MTTTSVKPSYTYTFWCPIFIAKCKRRCKPSPPVGIEKIKRAFLTILINGLPPRRHSTFGFFYCWTCWLWRLAFNFCTCFGVFFADETSILFWSFTSITEIFFLLSSSVPQYCCHSNKHGISGQSSLEIRMFLTLFEPLRHAIFKIARKSTTLSQSPCTLSINQAPFCSTIPSSTTAPLHLQYMPLI